MTSILLRVSISAIFSCLSWGVSCGQELDMIVIGDTAEKAKELIDRHDGIEASLAYTKVVDGKRVLGVPTLSYSLSLERCILMVTVDSDKGVVTDIKYGVHDKSVAPVPQKQYRIKSVRQFVFSHKGIQKKISINTKLKEVDALIAQKWKNRKLSGRKYWIDGKAVEFDTDDSGAITSITVAGEKVEHLDMLYLSPVFADRFSNLRAGNNQGETAEEGKTIEEGAGD